MWNFASKAISGTIGSKNDFLKSNQAASDCSDDEITLKTSREEGLECPICWEYFNIVENVPYVLWCGHTLCKNCVLGLQRAVVKFPTLQLQFPFFITCPWCNLLSLRLVYKGNLKFPRKNFFLLWMVESMNGDRMKSHSSTCEDHPTIFSSHRSLAPENQVNQRINRQAPDTRLPEQSENNQSSRHFNVERLHSSFHKFFVFVIHLTMKFPLVMIFLLIVLYAIPASAAILALYILITLVFALPSFFMLYFAYPALDWLVREIIT